MRDDYRRQPVQQLLGGHHGDKEHNHRGGPAVKKEVQAGPRGERSFTSSGLSSLPLKVRTLLLLRIRSVMFFIINPSAKFLLV